MKSALFHIGLLILLLFFVFSCQLRKNEDQIVIGVSQCTMEGAWRQSMLLEMKAQASEYPNLSLIIENASDSSLLQVEQIRSLIKKKVDLLIISANEAEPITSVAIEAFRAGIPTVLVDRKINSEEYTTYIGGDNYEIGRQAALFINRHTNKKNLNVLEIWGLPGSSSAQDRHKGFHDVLKEHVRVKEICGKWKNRQSGWPDYASVCLSAAGFCSCVEGRFQI